MNELKLSENLKASLQVFEEKLQLLRCVGTSEDATRESKQEADNKHPLTDEDESLIKDTFRKHVLKKYNCTTTKELEGKGQELQRNAETVWKMFDNARERKDYEGSEQFAKQAEDFERQAVEIKYALNGDLTNGKIISVFLKLIRTPAEE
jgi:hypothetical protein